MLWSQGLTTLISTNDTIIFTKLILKIHRPLCGEKDRMKKTMTELINSYNSKINYLKHELSILDSMEINSQLRMEYANNIAVTLRSLLCFKSGTESLCKRCGMSSRLFFPYNSPMEAQNILPSYILVGMRINENKATFYSIADDYTDKGLYYDYLTYQSWLNEVVIDFKSDDCDPISRKELIEIVADKEGAHVDNDYHPHLLKIARENVMPVIIETASGFVEMIGSNLFSESILSIAKELIVADSITKNFILKQRKKSKKKFYIQEFPKGNKYIVLNTSVPINPYNSNHYFECKLYESTAYDYEVILNNRRYYITMIDVLEKKTLFTPVVYNY